VSWGALINCKGIYFKSSSKAKVKEQGKGAKAKARCAPRKRANKQRQGAQIKDLHCLRS
jgi:hypothetical protein